MMMVKSMRILLLSTTIVALVAAQQQQQQGRNLRVTLDPKTVELKPPSSSSLASTESDAVNNFRPSPVDEAYLTNLKYAEPAILHHSSEGAGDDGVTTAVDVVSIGSNTRFDYMTSQLSTWAAGSRNFYGFSESNDYDPQCPEALDSDEGKLLRAYVNTCRAPNLGTSKFGVGHSSGGWFCAQRRPGRALGWLQAIYGKMISPTGISSSLPDILIIVDDDTSVDIDKVKQLMAEHDPNVPYIAAGAVFNLGKYGGFRAAHGGFGTYMNRAALERFTQPLYCSHDENIEILANFPKGPAHDDMCHRLSENRGGELDIYRPGDSIFDLFFKLASRPYFCFHSDWMMGFMITNYSGVELSQVEPPGRRGYCAKESINCHYQTPVLMEQFAMEHPQQQQQQQQQITMMENENNIGMMASDNNDGMAMAPVTPSMNPHQEMLDYLKRSEDIWLRGNYIKPGKTGQGASNYSGHEEQVSAARAQAELELEFVPNNLVPMEVEYVANNHVVSPLTVCDRPTYFPILQYPNADAPCPGFTQDRPMLLLERSGARGRTGNNLVEFLHAVQIARDRNIQLGTTSESWAMKLISQFWFESPSQESFDESLAALEETFCMKVFHLDSEMDGWDFVHMETGLLFGYHSEAPMVEYLPSQFDLYRKLFSRTNTGRGFKLHGEPSDNMCLGLQMLFPTPDERSTTIYTVIHSRHLEGKAGTRILGKVSKRSGCDSMAALEMRPEYIKAILEPLGMLQYPILFISDGQDKWVLKRLLADPDIGPQIRALDKGAVSLGADITTAIMSNVFIGNPASSFSTFIAKARMAMGFGHNELFWAVDPRNKEWRRVCGDNCLFEYEIQGAQI